MASAQVVETSVPKKQSFSGLQSPAWSFFNQGMLLLGSNHFLIIIIIINICFFPKSFLMASAKKMWKMLEIHEKKVCTLDVQVPNSLFERKINIFMQYYLRAKY